MQISSGKVVSIDYTLTDDAQRTLDTSDGGEPLTYLHGIGQLIPGLEGSTHINYGITVQFLKHYFFSPRDCDPPPALSIDGARSGENPYLFAAPSGGVKSVRFPDFLKAYEPLTNVCNVRILVTQLRALRLFLMATSKQTALFKDADFIMQMGRVVANIAYAQLIAEHATLQALDLKVVNAIFHYLVEDLGQSIFRLRSSPLLGEFNRLLLKRCLRSPSTSLADFAQAEALAGAFSA